MSALKLAFLVGVPALQGFAQWAWDKYKNKKRENTIKALKSKVEETFNKLKKQMEPMNRILKKLEKFKLHELHQIKADLEKELGKKDAKIARALESRLKDNIWKLSQEIQTLDRDVQEGLDSMIQELHCINSDWEKNLEEEFARYLEPRMKKKFQHLSGRIQTLEVHVQEWLESTMCDLQLLSAHLEKTQGNKGDEIARLLESQIENVFQHLSRIIQTAEEDLREREGFRKR